MSQTKRIAVIVGSLRKESFNRKAANGLIALAPDSLELEIVEIGDLPLYNQDFDDDPPEPYSPFRDKIQAADGYIFVTPEHNRSMPAAMKNALDIATRPPSGNVWSGKPGAVISASPSLQGGFGASHHLRQTLVNLNVLCMPQPEVYLSQANELFDDRGQPTERCRGFLQKFLDGYEKWVGKMAD
ncbi:NAD(P)H-dependent FMN reductase [Modicisalibacter ilicicola DSM 19980]|uniref:NAD(P)H-dependent FMN reductase n=1 Tax=Modicisalibacter ilicicola DSM 19980 TaxID=1121942 RepID=A0A1M5DT68_9GAMM|nr:NAD(P)H-dependent oxidoreductase [Halomonas ilicicola]SHF69992.1 NAD(P)H-dependent FMN reductase [Halomonas ilicicola DSM 19980]